MASQLHTTLVNWREWGEEAFREAAQQDKPILLDIGAVWCHWCHVMDSGIAGDPVHTGTYSRPDIAAYINARYIPIKVDNDRRPDINARYNMGGWPTTAFLTPSGDTIYGETYVSPDRMLELLDKIASYYSSSKEEIAIQLREHAAEEAGQGSLADQNEQNAEITNSIPKTVENTLKSMFDSQFGGFGNQPKFPHADTLEFAIRRYEHTGDQELRLIVEKTLTSMAGRGTYDHYAGGFFRYSTTRDWSVPHYEKMLEDNAALSRVCLLAARAFDEPRYAEIARDVHGWLFDIMHGGEREFPSPTFAGSQDADAEEAYYGLSLEARAKLPTPYIDRTVYINWNALMVSSLAERFRQFEEHTVLKFACETYDFLLKSVWPHHYYSQGRPQGESYLLNDVVAMLNAALDLHDVSPAEKSPSYLSDAKMFADVLLIMLQDTVHAGFFDMVPQQHALGALSKPKKELSSTSDASSALLRLNAYTDNPKLIRICKAALTPYASATENGYRAYGLFACQYALASLNLLSNPIRLVIVGNDFDQFAAVRRRAWQLPKHGRSIAIEFRSAELAGEFPASKNFNGLAAYLCVGTVCHAPVSSGDELVQLWERLRIAGEVR